MAYCVPQDVREVLAPDGGVSPGSDTAASLSDPELVQHIADASAQVDAALASAPTFYPSPLPVPARTLETLPASSRMMSTWCAAWL